SISLVSSSLDTTNNRLSSAEAKITPTAINLTVERGVFNDVELSSINLLPVGQRELTTSIGGWTYSSCTATPANGYTTITRAVSPTDSRSFFNNMFTLDTEPNQWYTLSADVYIVTDAVKAGSTFFVRAFNTAGSNIADFISIPLSNYPTGQWVRMTGNGKAPADTATSGVNSRFQISMALVAGVAGSVRMR